MRNARKRVSRWALVFVSCIANVTPPIAAEINGAVVEGIYTADILSSLSGGIGRGSAYVDNLDVLVDLDADELWGWSGTQLFVYALYNNGAHFSSEYVGELQGVSSIETGVSAIRLYEAWLNVDLSSNTSLKFGIYDLNSEFDVLESSQLFVGSAHGIGTDISQSGLNGPSIFPVTSLSLRLGWQFSDTWSAQIAILDGVPGNPDKRGDTTIRVGGEDGALLIGELQRSSQRSRTLLGAWTYTKEFEAVPFEGAAGYVGVRNSGVYLRGEVLLDNRRGELSAFGRYGVAEGDVNPFSHFASGGLHWRSFSKLRPHDEAGIAFAWAHSSAGAEESLASEEVAIELTYRWQVNDRFVLQPDIQYIINPGLDPELDNALVAGVRLEIQFL